MPGAIDFPPCPDSPLRRFDPRWKLAALLLALAAVSFLHTPMFAGLALAGTIVLVGLGRLPPRWCLARLGMVALAVGPFLILLPFFPQGSETPWPIGPMSISPAGTRAALVLAFKTCALVLLVLVLLATAPLTDTFKAAQRLRLPGLLVHLTLLAYRYIFLLADELTRLRIALRVRGYRNRASLHSYRTVGHVAGMLLVRGYERAERVGQAMRCRGFDGRFRSPNNFRTRPSDVLAFAAIVGGFAAVLTWDRRGW